MSPFAAYLIVIVNATSWSSTDIRRTPFASMDECRASLAEMRTISTASQAGDKSGMIAVAYCSTNPAVTRNYNPSTKEWEWW